jgi:hypothetical protein
MTDIRPATRPQTGPGAITTWLFPGNPEYGVDAAGRIHERAADGTWTLVRGPQTEPRVTPRTEPETWTWQPQAEPEAG